GSDNGVRGAVGGGSEEGRHEEEAENEDGTGENSMSGDTHGSNHLSGDPRLEGATGPRARTDHVPSVSASTMPARGRTGRLKVSHLEAGPRTTTCRCVDLRTRITEGWRG